MINHCTMKNNSIIAGIILFIVFLIVGYNTFSFFIHLTLRNMGTDQFLAATPNESLSHRLVYSITLALIPLTIVTSWKAAPIIAAKRKLTSIGIILACMGIGYFIRYEIILAKAQKLDLVSGQQLASGVLNIEYYMLLGLIAGAIINVLFLSEKQEKPSQLSF
jgi:hypothetical protein